MSQDGRRALYGTYEGATVQFWDLESGRCLKVLEGHSSGVTSVVMSADGKRALSSGADNTLRLWDLESARCLVVLECQSDVDLGRHAPWVASVAMSQDGRWLFCG